MNISVLQWNIWYKEDIENIAKLLRQYKPDIVCLQELSLGYKGQTHQDTPRYIADALGYAYHSKRIHINQPDWQLANGIFSRFPIKDERAEWINKPIGIGGYEDEYRAYIEATLDVGGKELTVGTTHMSYTHRFTNTKRKEAEAAKLAQELQKHKSNFIFTGDLNATPDSFIVRKATEHLKNAGPDYSQNTWTTKPFSYNGFEETELNWRLDYIFTTPDIRILSSKIIQTDYSDHLPIMIVVDI